MNTLFFTQIGLLVNRKSPLLGKPAVRIFHGKNANRATISQFKKFMIFMLFVSIVSSAIGAQMGFADTIEQRISLLLKMAKEYSKDEANRGLVMKLCSDAIKLQPQNADTYYHCGLALGRAGDYLNAIKSLSSVIRIDEKSKKTKIFCSQKIQSRLLHGFGIYAKCY